MTCETELAWAAGLFDGEGNSHCKRGVSLNVGQSGSPEVLVRFQAAVDGLGHLNGPYPPRVKSKLQSWQWCTMRDSHTVMAMLRPYLSSIKRAQYEEACVKYQEWRDAA